VGILPSRLPAHRRVGIFYSFTPIDGIDMSLHLDFLMDEVSVKHPTHPGLRSTTILVQFHGQFRDSRPAPSPQERRS
jgi:hypothetical protein